MKTTLKVKDSEVNTPRSRVKLTLSLLLELLFKTVVLLLKDPDNITSKPLVLTPITSTITMLVTTESGRITVSDLKRMSIFLPIGVLTVLMLFLPNRT